GSGCVVPVLDERWRVAGILDQTQRLIELGVHDLAGLSATEFEALAEPLVGAAEESSVLVMHPSLVPASRLAPLLSLGGKPGFVVTDMTDVDEFAPIGEVTIPHAPLYLVDRVERGDEYANWSPDEALPAITARGRRPLTLSEGISWLLQEPGRLEANRCFMTIGSRKPKAKGAGLDARTPAIWISRGTGRDGAHNNGAPKVGWCWAGNRHTWLGFASARS